MVRTFLKVYLELSSCFLFLQEQINDIIIIHFLLDVRPGWIAQALYSSRHRT